MNYQGLIEKLDAEAKKSEYSISTGKLTTVFEDSSEGYKVKLISNLDHLTLHWGLGTARPKD